MPTLLEALGKEALGRPLAFREPATPNFRWMALCPGGPVPLQWGGWEAQQESSAYDRKPNREGAGVCGTVVLRKDPTSGQSSLPSRLRGPPPPVNPASQCCCSGDEGSGSFGDTFQSWQSPCSVFLTPSENACHLSATQAQPGVIAVAFRWARLGVRQRSRGSSSSAACVRDPPTSVLTEALSTTVKIWNPSESLSSHEWIKNGKN